MALTRIVIVIAWGFLSWMQMSVVGSDTVLWQSIQHNGFATRIECETARTEELRAAWKANLTHGPARPPTPCMEYLE